MDINLTNANEVKKYVEQYARNQHTRIINRLHRAGLNFVTEARTKEASEEWHRDAKDIVTANKLAGGGALDLEYSFNDQTGQLRASIGYIVVYNGQVLNFNFDTSDVKVKQGKEDEREEGKSLAIEYANSLVKNEKGYCLICVAGANYAFYVEAKGYDVITGSSLEATETLRKWFR